MVERDAPSPEEKEVIEDIPFKQGVFDFSMILGERVFKRVETTYKFTAFDIAYSDRKILERTCKRLLMVSGERPLYDTHDNEYYRLAKCKSVEIEDDAEYDRLIVTIVFDCYPFLLGYATYFDDVWDTFDFEEDIAGFTKYQITDNKQLILINAGDATVNPEVTVTANMTIKTADGDYAFNAGTSKNLSLNLKQGVNYIDVVGTGELRIHWNREVIG